MKNKQTNKQTCYRINEAIKQAKSKMSFMCRQLFLTSNFLVFLKFIYFNWRIITL